MLPNSPGSSGLRTVLPVGLPKQPGPQGFIRSDSQVFWPGAEELAWEFPPETPPSPSQGLSHRLLSRGRQGTGASPPPTSRAGPEGNTAPTPSSQQGRALQLAAGKKAGGGGAFPSRPTAAPLPFPWGEPPPPPPCSLTQRRHSSQTAERHGQQGPGASHRGGGAGRFAGARLCWRGAAGAAEAGGVGRNPSLGSRLVFSQEGKTTGRGAAQSSGRGSRRATAGLGPAGSAASAACTAAALGKMLSWLGSRDVPEKISTLLPCGDDGRRQREALSGGLKRGRVTCLETRVSPSVATG